MVLRPRRLRMSCRLVERHRVFFFFVEVWVGRGHWRGRGFSLWFQAGIPKKMSVIDFGFYGSA